MRPIPIAIALMLAAIPAAHAAPADNPEVIAFPLLGKLAQEVKASELKATDTRLVGFGTRHTLSDTTSDSRGVGAARRWAKTRFETFGKECGGCLTVETPTRTFSGQRSPNGVEVMDVLAIQRGTTDPDRVVIISGHIDSRVTDVMNATAEAPGANDDGSGTSAVIEAARVLSKHRFAATIVYAVLQGEEQGLYGGQLLAEVAKAKGWQVEAQLNNDIIGNTHGIGGEHIDNLVRVFSEGVRADETPQEARARRAGGGENDSPSRSLARYLQTLAAQNMANFSVKLIYRADRFSRGGDQAPMQEAGFPAVRVTEATENYNRQHQDVRTESGVAYGDTLDGVDFPYLAQVTRLNVMALAALASAPATPSGVTVKGALGDNTTVSFIPAPGATGYRIWWRATDEPRWSHALYIRDDHSIELKGVNIDDWAFGVSALAGPAESPVEFPGLVGAFHRLASPPVKP